jgi:hypothetical protein
MVVEFELELLELLDASWSEDAAAHNPAVNAAALKPRVQAVRRMGREFNIIRKANVLKGVLPF